MYFESQRRRERIEQKQHLKKSWSRAIFEEIMVKNFPELIKDTKHRFKKHYEPHRTSIQKTTFKLI